MIKTQVKGLVWYNKKVFTGTAPKTFDEMLAINPAQYGAQKLFCAGFESARRRAGRRATRSTTSSCGSPATRSI